MEAMVKLPAVYATVCAVDFSAAELDATPKKAASFLG